MGGLQHAVAGKTDDGAVNLLVDLKVVTHFAAAVMPFDAGLQCIELVQIARLHPCCGEFRRASFDAAQRLEQFGQFVTPQRRDDGSSVEAKLDQTFGCQLLQGFAQRRPRDPERIGQIGFKQLLSGREIAADDQQTKPCRGLLMEAGSRHTEQPSRKRRHIPWPLGPGLGLGPDRGRFRTVHEDWCL